MSAGAICSSPSLSFTFPVRRRKKPQPGTHYRSSVSSLDELRLPMNGRETAYRPLLAAVAKSLADGQERSLFVDVENVYWGVVIRAAESRQGRAAGVDIAWNRIF